jgi:RNA polymerase sigma factor (TIGR02999 family)
VTPSPKSISQLLTEWRDGDETALNRLIPLVHDELRRLAHHYMRRDTTGTFIATTDLVNEAYLRLVDHKGMQWQNRAHFYAVSAQAMRRILVDHARSRNCAKRGGGERRVGLDEVADLAQDKAIEMIMLDDALTKLAASTSARAR